ncbi:putative multiple sugar transport system permease protein [Eubacterium ruminantium]|uniref:Xylose transport system permease protein XylH n=1 Tax=Eubacterium ruminantium TaxID=42322 RepID=A0A1T4L905_9FIRM|nr:sugar ABC transporter permease [Eubacterium ruminantium]SCW44193.1 putative multiple sugar transport system permease protein [Eubacterium ruminantium]SDM77576.1 putative multiple sugar transport system permease protein [Eubacterium ruminantium]SJZ51048.1 putative multiple sugar transport system permease protein [Eubacterium ruminantium]
MNENKQKVGLGQEVASLVKTNIRDYMMYIALVVIMVFFAIKTNGGFLQARNIANLINQAGYVAVMSIGMTLILILSHIDLSVGYVAGFSGSVAAILMTKYHMNEWLAILIVLGLGLLIGLYQGILVTNVGVPAFVTTLAGMFIFRGLLNLSLQKTGTIIIPNKGFNELSNGFIPDITTKGDLHYLTLIIGGLLVLAMIYTEIKTRKNKVKYDFEVPSMPIFIFKLIALSVIIMVVIWTLASYQGIPWTAVIVSVVLIIYNYMLNKTRLGRAIYGIGGNAQAAELSGINVKRVTLFAFCSVSLMAALGGILYTSRLQSATPTAGAGFELDAVASCYIGGVAVSGGVGRVTNTIIGTLVIMSLTNGMNLMGIDIAYQYIVKGLIFVIAVAFDVRNRKK